MTKKEAVDEDRPKDQLNQEIIQKLLTSFYTSNQAEYEKQLADAKKQIDNPELQKWVSFFEAKHLFENGQQADAKEEIDQLLKKLKEEKTELRARALMLRAEIAARTESDEELILASNYYQKALEIAQELKLPIVQGIAEMCLACIPGITARGLETEASQKPIEVNEEKKQLIDEAEHQKTAAIPNLQQAEKTLLQAYQKNPTNIETANYLAKIYINRANAISADQPVEARKEAYKAWQLAENHQLVKIMAIYYHVIAWSYLDEKNIEEAKGFFELEIAYINTHHLINTHSFPDAYFDLAIECKALLQPEQIKEYLKEALRLYEKFGNEKMVTLTQKELAQLAETEK